MKLDALAAIAAKVARPPESLAGLVARRSDAAAEASLYLYDTIGPEVLGCISASMVVGALENAKGVGTLHVRINSIGGSVFEAKAIYSTLRNFKAQKVVHVDGLAASAASFIAMAGDRILSAPEATWMIHNAMGPTMGDAAAHRDVADTLDLLSDDIRAIYAKRTGQSTDDLRAWMDAETMMNAETAKERGFCDGIEEEPRQSIAAAAPAMSALWAMAGQGSHSFLADLRRARVLNRLQQRPAPSRETSRPSPSPSATTTK